MKTSEISNDLKEMFLLIFGERLIFFNFRKVSPLTKDYELIILFLGSDFIIKVLPLIIQDLIKEIALRKNIYLEVSNAKEFQWEKSEEEKEIKAIELVFFFSLMPFRKEN